MTIFQVAAVLFALCMLYVVSIHRKKQTLSVVETSWWSSIWALFALIAIFPHILTGIAGALRFSRVFDLLLVVALMLLTLIVFFSYFLVKELQAKFERFVRTETFLEASLRPELTPFPLKTKVKKLKKRRGQS